MEVLWRNTRIRGMKNTLLVLDGECENLKLRLNDPRWNYHPLETIEQLDYELISSSSCALLVCAKSKNKLQRLMANPHFKSCNIPTIFLLDNEETESVDLCYRYDFTNVFIAEGNFSLIKAHIQYTFDNYDLCIKTNGQKWLRHIDPDLLTKKEFQIIEKIALAPLAEVSRDELKSIIWGQEQKSTNKLDVHICNLKKKLSLQNISLKTNERGKISLGIGSVSIMQEKVTT